MVLLFGGGIFPRVDFSWEGGGTLPQYRYKPFQDQCYPVKRTISVQWLSRSFSTDRQTSCYYKDSGYLSPFLQNDLSASQLIHVNLLLGGNTTPHPLVYHISLGRQTLLSIHLVNGFIITLILHHIFMFYNKVNSVAC